MVHLVLGRHGQHQRSGSPSRAAPVLDRPAWSPVVRGAGAPMRMPKFASAAHSERVTSRIGLALAVTFTTCFLTGLISHLIQHPPAWFWWPSRPAGLYRVTQGLH